MFRYVYKWFVFKLGDTRWVGWKHFPFIATWDVHVPGVPGVELEKAIYKLRKGDVILSRHNGFVSNLGIGGAMIHAMLYVGNHEVIEALSDDQGGVVKRHVSDAFQSDHLMVLRPTPLTGDEIDKAVDFAHKLLGFSYDIYFNFNSEEEKSKIESDPDAAKAEGVKLCCTELPHLCYIEHIDRLRLYREKIEASGCATFGLSALGIKVGKEMIKADSYIQSAFDIVYASPSCTTEWFKLCGATEAVTREVQQYWDKLK